MEELEGLAPSQKSLIVIRGIPFLGFALLSAASHSLRP